MAWPLRLPHVRQILVRNLDTLEYRTVGGPYVNLLVDTFVEIHAMEGPPAAPEDAAPAPAPGDAAEKPGGTAERPGDPAKKPADEHDDGEDAPPMSERDQKLWRENLDTMLSQGAISQDEYRNLLVARGGQRTEKTRRTSAEPKKEPETQGGEAHASGGERKGDASGSVGGDGDDGGDGGDGGSGGGGESKNGATDPSPKAVPGSSGSDDNAAQPPPIPPSPGECVYQSPLCFQTLNPEWHLPELEEQRLPLACVRYFELRFFTLKAPVGAGHLFGGLMTEHPYKQPPRLVLRAGIDMHELVPLELTVKALGSGSVPALPLNTVLLEMQGGALYSLPALVAAIFPNKPELLRPRAPAVKDLEDRVLRSPVATSALRRAFAYQRTLDRITTQAEQIIYEAGTERQAHEASPAACEERDMAVRMTALRRRQVKLHRATEKMEQEERSVVRFDAVVYRRAEIFYKMLKRVRKGLKLCGELGVSPAAKAKAAAEVAARQAGEEREAAAEGAEKTEAAATEKPDAGAGAGESKNGAVGSGGAGGSAAAAAAGEGAAVKDDTEGGVTAAAAAATETRPLAARAAGETEKDASDGPGQADSDDSDDSDGEWDPDMLRHREDLEARFQKEFKEEEERLLREQRRAEFQLYARQLKLVAELQRIYPIVRVMHDAGDVGAAPSSPNRARNHNRRVSAFDERLTEGMDLAGHNDRPRSGGSRLEPEMVPVRQRRKRRGTARQPQQRLYIRGLNLPMTNIMNHDEAQITSALGYVARLVKLMAAVFGVTLRYKLVPGGSRSHIRDHLPIRSPANEGKDADGEMKPYFEYPLYWRGVSHWILIGLMSALLVSPF